MNTDESISKHRMWLLVLILSIPIMPLWVLMGRAIFGVGGWGMLMMLGSLVPLTLLFHIVLLVLVLVFSKRPIVFKQSTIFLLKIYYALQLLFQLTFVDGGDTNESVKSGMSALLGEGVKDFSFVVANISLCALAVVAIMLIVNVIKVRSLRK